MPHSAYPKNNLIRLVQKIIAKTSLNPVVSPPIRATCDGIHCAILYTLVMRWCCAQKRRGTAFSRALTQDHGGGEGALDDGLEVSAIPRTPPRVARFARLEARGDGRAGVANRPARSLCLDGGHQRLNAHDVHDAGERRESIGPIPQPRHGPQRTDCVAVEALMYELVSGRGFACKRGNN